MEHPFDENDSHKTCYLSTRITQVEDKMLNEIGGWLQTGNKTATIRKQEIVRRTIRMAYEYLQIQLAHIDTQNTHTPTEPKISTHIMPTKQTHSIDLETYQKISNKTTEQIHRPNFLNKGRL